MEEKKISVIIPAYNEAKNIFSVLSVFQHVEGIGEVIVVNDGSTDRTAEIVSGFSNIHLMDFPENHGKTQAVLKAVREASYPVILLCDADLVNLNSSHLDFMITTYRQGYDMVIMDKGSQPWVFRNLLQSVPALSGTRILKKDFFESINFHPTDRFQLEIRINDHFLQHGLSIAIVPGSSIYDPRKYVKYPFFHGVVLDIKGGLSVLASDGYGSIYKNLRAFRKIRGYL